MGTHTYPGGVVVVDHSVPDGSHLFSMYGHLDPDRISVGVGGTVLKGQRIADGLAKQPYKGQDNTHLHWEMRFFRDGSGINAAPNYKKSCSEQPGPGYTYPGHPDNFVANAGAGPTYSWTNPSRYVDSHRSVLLAPLMGQPVRQRGETFFTNQAQLTYASGRVILSGDPPPHNLFAVDDAMELTITRPDGTTVTRNYIFQVGCVTIVPLVPQDITSLFQAGVNTVSVRLYDICGVGEGTANAIFLTTTD